MGIKLFKKKSKADRDVNHDEKETKVGRSTSTEESNAHVNNPTSQDNQQQRQVSVQKIEEKRFISGADAADKFKASEIYSYDTNNTDARGYKKQRSVYVPTARESAYNGPPRYDWIDVEAAAAIKVQSVFRRHQVLRQLEDEGKSTAAIRNSIRARNSMKKSVIGEDVPGVFRFCGLGLLFTDAIGDDTNALNAEDNVVRDEKFNRKIVKEEKMRKFRMRKKSDVVIEESVEVVDNLEE